MRVAVFLTGMTVMALEIIGSRMMAPYFGTSIVVWTSLIGIVLASLSIGYYVGGKVADRRPEKSILSNIIIFASLYIVVTAIFKDPVLFFVSNVLKDLRFSSFMGASLVLGLPSFLLGMVTPFSIKIATQDIKSIGQSAGNLYAISTLGSIFGTFLAGFVLISVLGHTNILILISAALLVAAVLVLGRVSFFHITVAVLIVAAFFISRQGIEDLKLAGSYDVDTLYSRIRIFESKDPATSRDIRLMVFDPKLTQSAMFLEGEGLVLDYTKYFRLGGYFKHDLKRALMIGGAAYSYPKDFVNQFPNSSMDVVEIDPALTDLARKYFSLGDNDRLAIFHEDARTFLNREAVFGRSRYDVVYIDAYNSAGSVPFQLTTKEAIGKIHSLLGADGVVLVNMISSIDGDTGRFLRAEYRTYKTVYDQVYLFGVQSLDSNVVQNIILVAIKGNKVPDFVGTNAEISEYLGHRYTSEVAGDMLVLVDDYAPVDEYLMPVAENL